MEMRREKESEGGGTYMNFNKNRNGLADVKMYYELSNSTIRYSGLMTVDDEE
jgi:hypothetical protein